MPKLPLVAFMSPMALEEMANLLDQVDGDEDFTILEKSAATSTDDGDVDILEFQIAALKEFVRLRRRGVF